MKTVLHILRIFGKISFVLMAWHVRNHMILHTLNRKINSINCEFYLRPQITISQFAETTQANLKYTEHNLEILKQKSITAFIRKTKKISKNIWLFCIVSKQKDET